MFRINIDDAELQPLLIHPVGGETYTSPGKLTVRWVGLQQPARVAISYDGGETYTTLGDNIIGDTLEIDIPLVKTSRARIRVMEIGTQQTLSSGLFSINPTSNVLALDNRGFHSEAIAVRGNYLWATQRGSDTIIGLRTPGVVPIGVRYIVRSGVPGTIRDLTFDTKTNLFYALVANADFSGAKVYRMDTNGVGQGEIPLPVSSVLGISSHPQGLALITPGKQGKLYIIDTDDGSVSSESANLQSADGDYRRGLVFDGGTFVQGVADARPGIGIPGEVQRFSDIENPRVTTNRPIVLPNQDSTIFFFGLAHDPSSSTPTDLMFFATDTAGAIFRFTLPRVTPSAGSVNAPVIVTGAASATIASVVPNPLRSTTTIELSMKSRQVVAVELLTIEGEHIAELFTGMLETGRHTVALNAAGLSSGIYHIVLTTSTGERDVRRIVVMK
jgi:hypothetical protein